MKHKIQQEEAQAKVKVDKKWDPLHSYK
jgi:hypothetical protein